MDNETIRILHARLVAHERLIEELLAILFAEKGPLVEDLAIRSLRNSRPDAKRELSDIAAEYWSDVAVRAQERVERIIGAASAAAAAARAGLEDRGPAAPIPGDP